MKKLNRLKAPVCLSKLKHGVNSWADAPKELIWAELEAMQQGFCAYCECKLDRKHIEHFKSRNKHPEETFNWDNLFGSCGDSQHKGGWDRCGIYKDCGPNTYQIENIIKPDSDSPDDYLLFLTSGKIIPKPNSEEAACIKATETIKVFNLNNNSALFNSRKKAIQVIQNEIDELYMLLDDLKDDWKDFLDEALNNTQGQEFETALRHAWSFNTLY